MGETANKQLGNVSLMDRTSPQQHKKLIFKLKLSLRLSYDTEISKLKKTSFKKHFFF